MLVSVTAVVVLLLIAFLAGTIFGRYVFKGKKLLYTMFFDGNADPVHSLLVPVFIELKTFSLNNNRFVLALIYAAFGFAEGNFSDDHLCIDNTKGTGGGCDY